MIYNLISLKNQQKWLLNKRNTIFFCLIVVCNTLLYAQNVSIKVVDSNSRLPLSLVLLKASKANKSLGLTDVAGYITIDTVVYYNDIITLELLGYEKQSIHTNKLSQEIEIPLEVKYYTLDSISITYSEPRDILKIAFKNTKERLLTDTIFYKNTLQYIDSVATEKVDVSYIYSSIYKKQTEKTPNLLLWEIECLPMLSDSSFKLYRDKRYYLEFNDVFDLKLDNYNITYSLSANDSLFRVECVSKKHEMNIQISINRSDTTLYSYNTFYKSLNLKRDFKTNEERFMIEYQKNDNGKCFISRKSCYLDLDIMNNNLLNNVIISWDIQSIIYKPKGAPLKKMKDNSKYIFNK